MGVLDGFDATWSKARETFGEGAPQTGERFDRSSQLREMQTTVESAAPGSKWTGNAASAYDAKNTKHGQILGEMASLDRRLNSKITESAHIVKTGRQNLDTVRQWVHDAAATVPQGKTREQMLMPIVKNGLSQVIEVVNGSNARFDRLASELRSIGDEYKALKEEGFGLRSDKPADMQTLTSEDEPSPGETEHERGPLIPGRPADPADPFVGNPDFGQWETISTSPTGPYPSLKPEFRPFHEDTPLKVGPTTGMYVPYQTWIADEDAPIVQYREGYRFRIAGTEATDITRVVSVNGETQVQRWVGNVYEYQKNTSVAAGGDLAGLPPIQNIDRTWERIGLNDIAVLSANNGDTTYYLPDGCGGTVDFKGGAVQTNAAPPTPTMTRPR